MLFKNNEFKIFIFRPENFYTRHNTNKYYYVLGKYTKLHYDFFIFIIITYYENKKKKKNIILQQFLLKM